LPAGQETNIFCEGQETTRAWSGTHVVSWPLLEHPRAAGRGPRPRRRRRRRRRVLLHLPRPHACRTNSPLFSLVHCVRIRLPTFALKRFDDNKMLGWNEYATGRSGAVNATPQMRESDPRGEGACGGDVSAAFRTSEGVGKCEVTGHAQAFPPRRPAVQTTRGILTPRSIIFPGVLWPRHSVREGQGSHHAAHRV